MKSLFCKVLVRLHMDRLSRYLNRKKLLVVMYHGICRENYNPPVWTQLPEKIFREQLQYLKSCYNIISLRELLYCLKNGIDFPERSALITFDDGLRNNYTVAFPVLKEYEIPAVIFLTMNFIGTDSLLWFDELLFLIKKSYSEKINCEDIDEIFSSSGFTKDVASVYSEIVEKMKRLSEKDRSGILAKMRSRIKLNIKDLWEDFGMLSWDQVLEMKQSDIVDFGIHTANHCILSNLENNKEEWESEISEPRKRLSKLLGEETESFCYPNGRPRVDFFKAHEDFLRESGFLCAFSSESVLHDRTADHYRIGRIPAGNDFTSEENYFKLSTSGVINCYKEFDRKILKRG